MFFCHVRSVLNFRESFVKKTSYVCTNMSKVLKAFFKVGFNLADCKIIFLYHKGDFRI